MAVNLKSDSAPQKLDAAGLRFALIVSRFNSAITDRLFQGARESLQQSGAKNEDIQTFYVPGAFELPLAAKQLAQTGEFDALIAIGCVIRGETSHYDYVCSESARGLQSAQLETGVPMIFCVLTCENQEQALARAGGAHGNKGHDSGLAAIEMAQLSNKLSGKDSKSASAPARKLRQA
jgi:6,7-dimethyl-8-ribityllumazine synthase